MKKDGLYKPSTLKQDSSSVNLLRNSSATEENSFIPFPIRIKCQSFFMRNGPSEEKWLGFFNQ